MSFLDNKIYYPMLLSEEGLEKARSSEEYKALWKKYLTIPLLSQNILTDNQLSLKIKNLQDTFRLNDIAIGNISLFIRKIFFEELSLQECEAKIGSMLTMMNGGDPNQARAIIQFVEKEILTIQPKQRVEEPGETREAETQEGERITASFPILQALSKYENLGNQLITRERIKIKTQGESVRPSLFYWLKYYRDELGIGQHNSVERGNFLFRSENGKNLSSEERERVNLILKSIEENLPLTIDTKRQEIVFPVFEGARASSTESGLERNTRQEASKIPTVPMQSVHLAPNQRQVFFHSADQTEMPRTTIQTDIPSSVAESIPPIKNNSDRLVQSDSRSDSSGPARYGLRNSSGGMSFSSSHMFPAEKDRTEQELRPASLPFDPFIIHPVSREEDDN